jgi:hypothetical protein
MEITMPVALHRRIMKRFPLLLGTYAAVGLIVSFSVHVLSCFGIRPGGIALFNILMRALIVFFLVMGLLTAKLRKQLPRRRFWKVALTGCPSWLKYMTRALMYYAIVNLLLSLLSLFLVLAARRTEADPPIAIWRLFSGLWMLFYSAGLALATTIYKRGSVNAEHREEGRV